MDIVDLSPNELKLLKCLRVGTLTPHEASLKSELGEKETMSAASWLRSKGLVNILEESTTFLFPNEEGKKYAEQGLPERRAVEWLNQMGESLVDELPLDDDEKKVVIGWLKRKKFAELEKTEGWNGLNHEEKKAKGWDYHPSDWLEGDFIGKLEEEIRNLVIDDSPLKEGKKS